MEYIWCMDSASRTTLRFNETIPENPTNDIRISPQLSVNRMTVTSMELLALDVPRAQKIVEKEWSRLYTCEGFRMDSTSTNTLRVQDRCHAYTASLPYRFNPVVGINENRRYRTKEPHLLEDCLHFWSFGQAVEILGLSSVVEITSLPQVINEFEFILTSGPVGSLQDCGNCVFLYYPDLPSPDYVARVLQAGLNKSFRLLTRETQLVFEVGYCKVRSRYSIGLTTAGRFAITDGLRHAELVDCRLGTIGSALGFGNHCHRLYSPEDPGHKVYAGDLPAGVRYVELPVGDQNYNEHNVVKTIENAFNRTYLKPIVTNAARSSDTCTNRYRLTVGSGSSGDLWTICVPPGLYTPPTLARQITLLLHAAWPQGSIRLLWDIHTETYTFRSFTDRIFSLEFKNEELTNIAYNLGFDAFRYSSCKQYTSEKVSTQWTLVDRTLAGSERRYNRAVLRIRQNTNAKQLTMVTQVPTGLPSAGTSVQMVGSSVQVRNNLYAHGFQVDDVVEIVVGERTMHLRVSAVDSATEFRADLCDPSGSPGVDACESMVTHVSPPTVSFLCGRFNECTIPAELLGFSTSDMLWETPRGTKLPYSYDLQGVDYILLECCYPVGSTHIEHRYGSDNRTTILGKLRLNTHCSYISQSYAMKVVFFTGVRLEYCQFRLLNPNHTLYQLHGRDWTATIRFNTSDRLFTNQ